MSLISKNNSFGGIPVRDRNQVLTTPIGAGTHFPIKMTESQIKSIYWAYNTTQISFDIQASYQSNFGGHTFFTDSATMNTEINLPFSVSQDLESRSVGKGSLGADIIYLSLPSISPLPNFRVLSPGSERGLIPNLTELPSDWIFIDTPIGSPPVTTTGHRTDSLMEEYLFSVDSGGGDLSLVPIIKDHDDWYPQVIIRGIVTGAAIVFQFSSLPEGDVTKPSDLIISLNGLNIQAYTLDNGDDPNNVFTLEGTIEIKIF